MYNSTPSSPVYPVRPDHRRCPEELESAGRERIERARSAVSDEIDELDGTRTLNRDHFERVGSILDRDIATIGMAHDPCEIGFAVGSIDDNEIRRVAGSIDDDVIDHSPVFSAQQAVLGSPDCQLAEIGGDERVDHLEGIRSGHFDLAHVIDVEQPDRRTGAWCSAIDPVS